MSEDVVIRAEGLGKKYLIGHQAEGRQDTLRDAISHGLVNFTRTTRDLLRGKPMIAGDEIEEFWALRVSTSRSGEAKLSASSVETAPVNRPF